jgi:hypothetical protein
MREDQTPRADRPAGGADLPLPGIEEGRAWEEALEHQAYPDADFETNELHTTGRVCARCGRPLAPTEDVRLTASGAYQHESCPA